MTHVVRVVVAGMLLTLLLSGCVHTPVKEPTGVVPAVHRVAIDRTLLVPCKPIPELAGDTELDLITWVSEWKLIYLECKRNHSALVTTIKSAFPQDSK